MTKTPYLPSQLRDLADEPTQEEGGTRDSDWMAEAVIALRDAATQIENLIWANQTVASMQPPTREQIVKMADAEIEQWMPHASLSERSIAGVWFRAGADAVLALFSQPTSSAEPVQYNGHNGLAVFADAARRLNEGQVQQPTPSAEESIRADEREQWASYFQSADDTVGCVPLTYAMAAEFLRGPKPFGIAQGDVQNGSKRG